MRIFWINFDYSNVDPNILK